MINAINCAERLPEVEILKVPGSDVAEDFDCYQDLMLRALEHEQEPLELLEILQLLRSNLWLCLVIRVGGDLTGLCICEQRKKRVGFALEVMMISGDGIDTWIDVLIRELTTIAGATSCDALTLCGRMGWLRMLKGRGFKAVSQNLRMELT
jgi:hypothetical protein